MPDTPSLVSSLVASFRRQRPLRGGSLIVTIFGDSILPRGGAIALGSLIELAAPFGLNERLVRTASVRLAKEGWLEGRRRGNRSEYRLSSDGRERFADATKRIYDGPQTAWSGRWTLVVLPPMRAMERRELRKELIWRGFGELSSGVFAHPEVDPHALRLQLRPAEPSPKLLIFDANLAADDAPQRLVALGWNLDELSLRYQRFVKRFERIRAALHEENRLQEQQCFVVRTLLIHEYRRLHLRDPLLPARLLRANWPGTHAEQLCRDIYSRVFAPSEKHLSKLAVQLDGPLPSPDPSVMQRFGGIAPA